MRNKPIGIFDTGIGGISVLRTAKRALPKEKFIYLADFENAPYGSKTKQEILDLTLDNIKYLIDRGIKAAVIACNTATSAAIRDIRQAYSIPIIGMEPAIKPASQKFTSGKTIVLATPATLKFMKYQKLYESLGNTDVIPLECPGLSRLIEETKPNSIEIKNYLKNIFSSFDVKEISAIVIGCTHYSFIEDDISKQVSDVSIFDGRYGTVRYLKKALEENNLLSDGKQETELISKHDDRKYQDLLIEFMKTPLKYEDNF